MEFSKEQIEEIKKQVLEQINSIYPDDKKEQAKKQIISMNDGEFIEFIKQNNLVKEGGGEKQSCIFCSIVFGEIPSVKIGENEKAIAILEINPISNGHAIIVPKNHIEKKEGLENEVILLANEIKEKLQITLQPKEVQLINSNIMGHEIINVLPIYDNETINSPKTKKTNEELEELKKLLEEEKEEKIEEKKETIISEDNKWIPKRIP